jgi:phage terminase small subunit
VSKLTNKQRLFIDAYLTCWNATEAARRAGYSGNDVTLASVGYENLRKPQIKKAIGERLQESMMSAEEALMRLAQMARADIGDYIDEFGIVNWKAVKENGYLFKEVIHTKDRSSFKMNDPQIALIQILKAQGIFVQKMEHTGKDGGPIETRETGNYSDIELARSKLALAQALRSASNNQDTGKQGDMGSAERAAVDGDTEPG